MEVQVCMRHYLWGILISLHWNLVFSQADSRDLLLTLKEKNALDTFKEQVSPLLEEEFMKSDFYLVRWLRVKNWDIPSAKTMLLDNVKWRKDNKINSILQENWSDVEQDFPASFHNSDKIGRPILTMNFGEWDFRAVVLAGKSRRLDRYLTYTTEKYVNNVFKAQAAGKNVTRALILIDMDGFSIQRTACPLCIPIFIRWTSTMESYYPQFTNEIVMINAPSAISIPLNAIKPFMTPDTRDQLKAFDTNKQQWMKYLDARVDRSQRTQRYGGTKSL
ncbi:SEC14-like protein 4 [Orchesella cincta]|uniref:SEC14-like protein 4 n=1 Tax=Orchesella cincta TaxID=48709 RepID=A0A1D2M7A1_ORCCI|nr:SEC14-like protein 4 [Orchesella cincta]